MKSLLLMLRKIGFLLLMLCMPLGFVQYGTGEFLGKAGELKSEVESGDTLWISCTRTQRRLMPEPTPRLLRAVPPLTLKKAYEGRHAHCPETRPPSPLTSRALPMLC